MSFEELLKLLQKGESLTSGTSGIIGGVSGILNMLGLGRKKQIRQQKEMAENAAKINYKYYRDWETDRKSTRLNSSHSAKSRMPSSA